MDLTNNMISRIQSIARRYPIDRIVLFGSRARGDNGKYSDIDLAVFQRLNSIRRDISAVMWKIWRHS